MQNITMEEIHDNIEQCRALCDELMIFQKSKAKIGPERFDKMDFDTRMKKSFENALKSQVIVAKDNGIPIGYVFSTVEETKDAVGAVPDWAEGAGGLSFMPPWDHLPEKYGCVSNLYLREEYRGTGIGNQLFERALQWLESLPEVDLIMIYVSNGNKEALDFYLRRGFVFSHDVFNGFIQAVYKWKSKAKHSAQ